MWSDMPRGVFPTLELTSQSINYVRDQRRLANNRPPTMVCIENQFMYPHQTDHPEISEPSLSGVIFLSFICISFW
jgi:hypothetical protein